MISVCIPEYRTPDIMLRKCLDSLQSQTLDKDKFEVIISRQKGEGDEDILKGYDLNLKVLQSKSHDTHTLRMRAVKESKYEYVLFMDSDSYLVPEALEIYYFHCKGERQYLYLGSHKLSPLFCDRNSTLVNTLDNSSMLFSICGIEESRRYVPVSLCSSYNILVKRNVALALNKLEILDPNSEDRYYIQIYFDLCRDVRYIPQCVCYHMKEYKTYWDCLDFWASRCAFGASVMLIPDVLSLHRYLEYLDIVSKKPCYNLKKIRQNDLPARGFRTILNDLEIMCELDFIETDILPKYFAALYLFRNNFKRILEVVGYRERI